MEREGTAGLLPSVRAAGGTAEFVEDGFGFFELGEEFFGVAEDFGMNAAAGLRQQCRDRPARR